MKTDCRRSLIAVTPFIVLAIALGGCEKEQAAPSHTRPSAQAESHDNVHDDDHGHGGHQPSHHDHDKMLAAKAGSYRALVTAVIIPEGNRLELIFETGDHSHARAALPSEPIRATAILADGTTRDLVFQPALPATQPGGQTPKTSTLYFAETPWLKKADVLDLTARVQVEESELSVEWKGFTPTKHAIVVE